MANIEEVRHLADPLGKMDEMLSLLRQLMRQAVQHEAFRELAMTVRRRWYRKG